MSDEIDPPRFGDPGSDAPGGLRDLFSSAARDLPGAAEIAPLWTRIDAAVAPAGSGGASLARAGSTKGVIAGSIGIGVVALVGLGYWLGREQPPAPPAMTVPARPNPPPAVPRPVEDGVPTAVAPPSVAPTEAAAPAATASARKTALPTKPSEAALLEAARAVLNKQPSRALALTREHARLYPSGVLVQEREVIAIEALRRLGDERGAEQRAGDFRRTFPSSPHRRSVDP